MIFWRGWGGLGLGIPALGGITFGALSGVLPTEGAKALVAGLLFAITGSLTFLLGRRLNVTGVEAKTNALLAQRRAQLEHLVTSGQFQAAPGVPVPSSLDEARRQAGEIYVAEEALVRKRLTNCHTLWFIPFQYVGVAVAAIGVVAFVVGTVQTLMG